VKHHQRTREISSLGFSLGIHAGVLVIGLIIWVATSTPPPPEPLQVELVRLPPPTAPVEGQPQVEPPSPDATTIKTPTAKGRTRTATPRLDSGPSVEHRVRVARKGWHNPGADPCPSPPIVARWEPAADLNVREHDHRDHDYDQLTFAMAGAGTHKAASRTRSRPARNLDALPFHVHDHGSGVIKRLVPALPRPALLTPGGSRKALLKIIQARINAVAPLVHRTSEGCRNASGLARIRFVIDTQGYPIGYQILDSSGNRCLDGQIDTLLHLAEPYPFVAGWVPVRVRFTL
jgi:outer membrane biosynthesis protein TonB